MTKDIKLAESEFSTFEFVMCKFIVVYLYTLSRLKYFNTTKLTCTNCFIYWLSAKLGSKKEIEICKYIKYDVSAWLKFLVFREVLIY